MEYAYCPLELGVHMMLLQGVLTVIQSLVPTFKVRLCVSGNEIAVEIAS